MVVLVESYMVLMWNSEWFKKKKKKGFLSFSCFSGSNIETEIHSQISKQLIIGGGSRQKITKAKKNTTFPGLKEFILLWARCFWKLYIAIHISFVALVWEGLRIILFIEEGEQEVTGGKGCENFRFLSTFSCFHLNFTEILHCRCFIVILHALKMVKGENVSIKEAIPLTLMILIVCIGQCMWLPKCWSWTPQKP